MGIRILVFSGVLLLGCYSVPNTAAELKAAQSEIKALQAQLDRQVQVQEESRNFAGLLVHVVTLQLKATVSEAERQTIRTELEKLAELPQLQTMQIGTPADTGDPRAVTDYDFILHMGFNSMETLASYQQDERHLAVRAAIGPFLAGPPVVYDFYTR